MTIIHLLGGEGFIGRSLQREAGSLQIHSWSHQHSDPNHYFDLLDRSSWQALLKWQPTHAILLSWPGLPNYQEPFHVTRNLPACVDLIEQLVASGPQRLVVAGTCYEYGLQNGP
jgi:nucleoside-diphosphate-sugar epimerase